MPVLCNYISLKSTIYTERAIICPWRSWQIPSLERQLYHARLRLCSTWMSINSPTKKQWTGFLKKRVIVANPVIMWFSSRIKDPWSLIAILVLSLIWISCYATKDLGLAGSPIRCYIVYGCFFATDKAIRGSRIHRKFIISMVEILHIKLFSPVKVIYHDHKCNQQPKDHHENKIQHHT